jgi:hypothetical protein
MNDSEELRAARKILHHAMDAALRQRIKPYLKENKIQDPSFEEACIQQSDVLVNAYYQTTEKVVAPFICSFCSHEGDEQAKSDGLLSQWRGYGADGGFALEFEAAKLEELMGQDADSHNGYYMVAVIYGEASEKFELLKDDIKVVTNTAFEMLLCNLKLSKDEPNIDESYFPFMRCATCFKHSGFREEQEIRIVHIRQLQSGVPDGRKPYKIIEFRRHRGSWVPYVSLFSAATEKLPLRRIMVGPHPRSDLRRRALELFLKQAGIEAEVHVSRIPYLPE